MNTVAVVPSMLFSDAVEPSANVQVASSKGATDGEGEEQLVASSMVKAAA